MRRFVTHECENGAIRCALGRVCRAPFLRGGRRPPKRRLRTPNVWICTGGYVQSSCRWTGLSIECYFDADGRATLGWSAGGRSTWGLAGAEAWLRQWDKQQREEACKTSRT